MAQSDKDDLPDGLSEIFFATGLDRKFDLPVGQSHKMSGQRKSSSTGS
jgi:hypothetical protein